MVTKIALQKSSEWSYEKEWRIIYTNNDVATQSKANVPFSASPTALYLGRRISHLYERLLKDIANEKGIPVYKMFLDDNSPTYRLIPKKVQ
jgi:antitoxin component of RelBE/YafQ-DinJ toxin-antitoxin module